MKNALDILRERGFVKQVTFEDDLYKAFDEGMVTFYTGFDPTADSLHIGHYIPIMAMAHLQRAGHKPDRADGRRHRHDRRSLRQERPAQGAHRGGHRPQRRVHQEADVPTSWISIQSKPNCAIIVNNADWLRTLNYIDFLRDVGSLFSVNRMLDRRVLQAAPGARPDLPGVQLHAHAELRLPGAESPLRLHPAGRRRRPVVEHALRRGPDPPQGAASDAFALTFQLLLTHDGRKMGKTEKGALWLDADKCSPYDFYQYWRNVDDADVEKCLGLLTFLPMDEVRRLGALEGSEPSTRPSACWPSRSPRTIHGEEEAIKAQQAAEALFGGGAMARQRAHHRRSPAEDLAAGEPPDGAGARRPACASPTARRARPCRQGGLYRRRRKGHRRGLPRHPRDARGRRRCSSARARRATTSWCWPSDPGSL